MRTPLILLSIAAIVVIAFFAINNLPKQETLTNDQPPETITPPGQLGRPESGPQDFALTEATVLSAEGTNVNVQIDNILNYRRDPGATWEQLKDNDQITVSISIAKVVPLVAENTREDITCTDEVCYGEVSGTQIDVADLGEERISNFASTLVGKKIVISMNCASASSEVSPQAPAESLPSCNNWFEGTVHEIL